MLARAGMDREKAEVMCAGLGVNALLAMLSAVEPWQNGVLTRQYDKVLRPTAREGTFSSCSSTGSESDLGILAEIAGTFSNPPSEDGGATVISSDFFRDEHCSPRIELVTLRGDSPPNYQIREVTSSSQCDISVTTLSSDSPSSSSNNLGKRKNAPSEEEHHQRRSSVLLSTAVELSSTADEGALTSEDSTPLHAPRTPEDRQRRFTLSESPRSTSKAGSDKSIMIDGRITCTGEALDDEEFSYEASDIEDQDLDEETEEIEGFLNGANPRIQVPPVMFFASDMIPYIPQTRLVNLGPIATSWLADLWWDARLDLRACYCRICDRSRKKEQEDDSDWVDMDDHKRMRVR